MVEFLLMDLSFYFRFKSFFLDSLKVLSKNTATGQFYCIPLNTRKSSRLVISDKTDDKSCNFVEKKYYFS